MKKKILVTGCAGFIGYHLAKQLINTKKYKIFGIDNLNKYYDLKLKLNRLKLLKKNNNFTFFKIDISNKNQVIKNFKKQNYDFIFHLAAQAGVRYSITSPDEYFKSNLLGFYNILNSSKLIRPKTLFFASSSSVYGNQKKLPISEVNQSDSPISFYAASKKCNEVIAHSFSHIYKLKIIGLRFFTVYGPFGRPDMTPYSFLNNHFQKKKIKIFNKGKHMRDFTYIDDTITSIIKIFEYSQKNNRKKNYELINVARGKSIKLMQYIKLIEKNLGLSLKKKFISGQDGDVKNTFANINKLKKYTNYKPSTDIDIGIMNFIKWYENYHNVKKTRYSKK